MRLKAMALSFILLSVSSVCFANEIDWNNGGDGVHWSDVNNWVGGVSPGAGDYGRFNSHFGPCPSATTIDIAEFDHIADDCGNIAFTQANDVIYDSGLDLNTGGTDTYDTGGFMITSPEISFDGAWTLNNSQITVSGSVTITGAGSITTGGSSVLEFAANSCGLTSNGNVFDSIIIDFSATLFPFGTMQATNITNSGVLELQGNFCVGNMSFSNYGSLYAYGDEFILNLVNAPGSVVNLNGSNGSYNFFGGITYDTVQIIGTNATFSTSGDLTVNGNFYNGSTVTFQNRIVFNGSTFQNVGRILSTALSVSTFTYKNTETFSINAASTTLGNMYYLPAAGGTPILKFASASTITVSGIFQSTVTGVTFIPSTNGNQWYLRNTGTNNTKNINVRDSNASLGNTINCLVGCTNTSNNLNWNFGGVTPSSSFRINGGGNGSVIFNGNGLGRVTIQ